MKVRRGGITEHATIDITPTIDVVFQLLIFFISTIQMPTPEADIQTYLPKQEKVAAAGRAAVDDAEETKNVNQVTIAIQRGPGGMELRLNGALLPGGFRGLDGALRSLRAVAAQTPDIPTKIVLNAHRQAPYRYVVTTLDLCAKHKFNDVSFAMPPPGEGA